ncbi:MAG TPA: HD-GYP domain-containing protein [Patescibacteria group bacterium]|nr:HD-GYP domain-containing protein [Patescibacteria group bacterium]
MPKDRLIKYKIQDLLPGQELGNAVLTDDMKVILEAGTILTQSMIDGLDFWAVDSVSIRERAPGEQISFDIPETASQRKFYQTYDDTVTIVKESFETMRFFKEVPLSNMKDLVNHSIDPLVNAVGVINHLQMVHRQDDYTFHHSINVAVICGVLGKWLGYQGEEWNDLILAGLLHDVGKTQIPLEILNKPGELTAEEMEIMRLHTTRGFDMVRSLKELAPGVIYGVLQHHEKMDGSGYPFRVRGEKVHAFAKIIAVADVYDAMTSDRVYRAKVTPFKVVEELVEDMFGKMDPMICMTFLNNVRDYFIGNIVRLNDGREAEVVYLGQFMASRPVVVTQDGESIDLERDKSVSIVDIAQA